MLTLALLRHAKSSWSDATALDRDRPLAARGLAVINFENGFWKSIAVNGGTLSLFLTPKDLHG